MYVCMYVRVYAYIYIYIDKKQCIYIYKYIYIYIYISKLLKCTCLSICTEGPIPDHRNLKSFRDRGQFFLGAFVPRPPLGTQIHMGPYHNPDNPQRDPDRRKQYTNYVLCYLCIQACVSIYQSISVKLYIGTYVHVNVYM